VLAPALTDQWLNSPAQADAEIAPLLREGSPRVKQFVIFRLSRNFQYTYGSKTILVALEDVVTSGDAGLALLALDLIGTCWRDDARAFLETIAAGTDPRLSFVAKCWLAEDPRRSRPWE